MKFYQVLSTIAALCRIASALPAGYNIPPLVVGRQFFLNGKIQRLAGTNAWWLGHLYNDSDVDLAASQIASSGIQVARVWGFGNSNTNDTNQIYYQLITPSGISINHGPNGIARLDSAIRAAERHGLKLILPLLNNWDDLGGISTYCAVLNCTSTSFFTSPAAQAVYRSWISFMIRRYARSPAIFAWELMNEPRCQGCNTSVITTWAQDTSAFIKSLDPVRMVALGDEGWWGNGSSYSDGSYGNNGEVGIDFEANLRIDSLDYGTVHLYPSYWGHDSQWGNGWIEGHAAATKAQGKPVVLEEYGCFADDGKGDAVDGDCEREWQMTARESGMAMDQIWQFATRLPSGANPFDGFAVWYNATKGSLYDSVVVQNVRAWVKAPILF